MTSVIATFIEEDLRVRRIQRNDADALKHGDPAEGNAPCPEGPAAPGQVSHNQPSNAPQGA